MAKLPFIELGPRGSVTRIAILYEDRAVLAMDKPAGWLLAPTHWQNTARNLQAAIESSIAAGDFWARSRNLRYLRFVHRLDAETTGALLLAKSAGALAALSELFEERSVEKLYLAIVRGIPKRPEWVARERLRTDDDGRASVDERHGKEAETAFRVVRSRRVGPGGECTLLEARPRTGRTHQIRIHLAVAGHPVLGDGLYGGSPIPVRTALAAQFPLALRAVSLRYPDPFTHRPVRVEATRESFLRAFGFEATSPPAAV